MPCAGNGSGGRRPGSVCAVSDPDCMTFDRKCCHSGALGGSDNASTEATDLVFPQAGLGPPGMSLCKFVLVLGCKMLLLQSCTPECCRAVLLSHWQRSIANVCASISSLREVTAQGRIRFETELVERSPILSDPAATYAPQAAPRRALCCASSN